MKKIDLGIGLATGRRSFKKVLNAYIATWNETKKELPQDIDVHLSLFVSYDLNYQNTQSTDFTNLKQDIVDAFDDIIFIGPKNTARKLAELEQRDSLPPEALKRVFGSGYAGKRNAILLAAIELKMDYLLFLDDDEYPMAVTNNNDLCLWSGQRVFYDHLKEIEDADYTNGYHCGYISPIPQMRFNNTLGESDFRLFVEAISNDIISWDTIRQLMATGGVTYASTAVLAKPETIEVPWENGCRFISGANLCINLRDPLRSLPFYNPPGARGEDTFLSTMLRDRKVLKVPCYAFHDGFSYYQHLLDGVLPIHLAHITAESPQVVTRFFKACVGWVRYKPLLCYITKPDEFETEMRSMRSSLEHTVPLMAENFQDERFLTISTEFEKYCKNVKRHYAGYIETQKVWQQIIRL